MSRRGVRLSLLVVGIPIIVLLILLFVFVQSNLSRNITWARRDRAASEIKNIDFALTKLLTDVNRQYPSSLFIATEFDKECKAYMASANLDAFVASTRIYTVCLTALLQNGKNTADVTTGSDNAHRWLKTIDPNIYRRLGNSYMNLGTDPWGNPYYMFAGPWPAGWGPKVFRTYRDSSAMAKTDVLTVDTNSVGRVQAGFVPAEPAVYLWSSGPNGFSDQARFDPSGKYTPPASQHYRQDAAPYELGGGDDVNNWDDHASWSLAQADIPPDRKAWLLLFGSKHDQMSDW